jgi:hypothetical protein
VSALLDRLAMVPDVEVPLTPAIEDGIADSVRYLESDAAVRSLEADTYWPKWHSPWWHMVVLWELGEARRIPERVQRAMVDGLNALPITIFPIQPEDTPPGVDAHRGSSCHCALGTIYQVLAACGLEVDRELPWAKPWFLRYQMADGGFNCDGAAYLTGECPSSMVGTIAPFEAMLLGEWSLDQRAFLERGAAFLVGRELTRGSDTVFNAEEREAAPSWLLPCSPRLYFYDVLRGARALVRYIEAGGGLTASRPLTGVVRHLIAAFPDGIVRVQRRAYDKLTTLARGDDGEWHREPSSRFPLLEATSIVGAPSATLTRQWSELRQAIDRLALA